MATIKKLLSSPNELVALPHQLKLVMDKARAQDLSIGADLTSLAHLYASLRRQWFPNKKQNYTNQHLAEQIFLDTPLRQQDAATWICYQLYALEISTNRYADLASQICVAHSEEVKAYFEFVTALAFDSVWLLEFGEFVVNKKEIHYAAGNVKARASMESWAAANDIFLGKVRDNSIGSSMYRTASVFLLRQAIELRFKHLMNIEQVLDSSGREIRIDAPILFDLVKSLDDLVSLPIEFSVVKKIYTWSNGFIHSGVEPHIWQVDWAFAMLEPLFANGERQGHMSIYGGVKIRERAFAQFPSRLTNLLLEKRREKRRFSIRRLWRQFRNLLRSRSAPEPIQIVFRSASPEALVVTDNLPL